MRYVNRPVYICEYLPDGLTAKIVKIRRDLPLTSMSFYAEQASRFGDSENVLRIHFEDTIYHYDVFDEKIRSF